MNTDTNDREELKKQVEAIIDKAERSLKAAGRLINDEDLDFGVSRLYYALNFLDDFFRRHRVSFLHFGFFP